MKTFQEWKDYQRIKAQQDAAEKYKKWITIIEKSEKNIEKEMKNMKKFKWKDFNMTRLQRAVTLKNASEIFEWIKFSKRKTF